MKIESYDVSMQASSSFVQKQSSSMNASFAASTNIQDRLSQNADKNSNAVDVHNLKNLKVVHHVEDDLSHIDLIKKRIIELLLKNFTHSNHEIKLYPSSNQQQIKQDGGENPYKNLEKSAMWGFSFESTQEYYQKSSIDFSTQATIKTNAGEFNIDINMSYTQEFYEMHKTSFNASGGSIFQDPLLINYDAEIGTFDSISKKMSFEFDLNSDGQKETIPELINGTGFLALDKNGNGEVDDGSELFGPTTGDGFEELRAYDEDGNNWIDENDSIYNDLRVWERDENGNNSLITLSQAGVGAIYLAGINTDFNYANGYDDISANMKETSFFLKENGEAGIVSSVDFAV